MFYFTSFSLSFILSLTLTFSLSLKFWLYLSIFLPLSFTLYLSFPISLFFCYFLSFCLCLVLWLWLQFSCFKLPIFPIPERQGRSAHVPERQRHLAASRSSQPRRRVPTQTSSGCLRLRRDVQDMDRECHRVQTKLKTMTGISILGKHMARFWWIETQNR